MAVLSKVANIAVQPQPVGVVEAFAGTNAPNGWLICDGSQVLRSLYPELFSVIGTTYGSGDGFSTFTLPDLRGRTIAGRDGVNNMNNGPTNRLTSTHFGASGTALGNSGGVESHTLTTAQLAVHSHSDSGHSHASGNGQSFATSQAIGQAGSGASFGAINGFVANTASASANIGNAGSGNAHNNTQPTMILNYIIKAVSELPRGGWYNSSAPDVVTSLPTNPYVGQEIYHYVNSKIYAKRYNGSTWESLINANATDLPAGTVIQAVTRTTSTNNSLFNGFIYSDCYCYITPQFSTSKILVLVSASVFHSSGGDSGYGGGIYSNVGGQLVQVSRVGHGYDGSAGGGSFNGMSYLASPNTTSNHYYQLTLDAYRNNQGTTVQLNRSYQQTDYSTMTLLEIRA